MSFLVCLAVGFLYFTNLIYEIQTGLGKQFIFTPWTGFLFCSIIFIFIIIISYIWNSLAVRYGFFYNLRFYLSFHHTFYSVKSPATLPFYSIPNTICVQLVNDDINVFKIYIRRCHIYQISNDIVFSLFLTKKKNAVKALYLTD